MVTLKSESEARRRIVEIARNLFYKNGYRATGINEIIAKSGVAKATFYAHFPSKADLALAYVKSMNESETREMIAGLESFKKPYEKLMGLLEFLIPWSVERDYRGCAYLNISSEINDHENPVRQESMAHYAAVRGLIGTFVKQLQAERGAAWKNRDPEKIADDFMLIFSGALTMAQVYHDPAPFHAGMEAARRLLA